MKYSILHLNGLTDLILTYEKKKITIYKSRKVKLKLAKYFGNYIMSKKFIYKYLIYSVKFQVNAVIYF